jgi:hypothetical protein
MYMTTGAIDLRPLLPLSPKKRGQYVSNLIKRAALGTGLVPTAQPTLADRIARLERELSALKVDSPQAIH